MIPYMTVIFVRSGRDLANADAIVAVSDQVAAYLKRAHTRSRRPPELRRFQTESMLRRCARTCARQRGRSIGRTPIFVGKLALNKGVAALVDVVEHAKLDMPLVVIGEGPERPIAYWRRRHGPGRT